MADVTSESRQPASIESVSWLQLRLRQAAARRRAIELATLAGVAAAVVVLAAGAYGVADWLVRFPRPVRLALTVAAVAVGLLAWRRHVGRWVPPPVDADAMARLSEEVQERTGKKAHSRLVAAIEFGERPLIPGDTDLKNQVIREARTACLDPCALRLYNPRHMWLVRRLGGAALAVLVAVACLCPHTAAVFLRRMCGSSAGYPTVTRLAGVEWRPVAPARQNYPLRITVSGRIPPAGVLHVRMTGRRGYDLPLLTTETPGVFSTVVPSPEKPFSFVFRLGDYESDRYVVRVAEPMYVKTGRVQVRPPAYTRQPPATEALGNLTVPEGSELHFEIQPDREARQVSWTADGRSTNLTRRADGMWTLTTVATNSVSYTIDMQDPYGMENADRLKRGLVVIPDAPPTVEVRQPKAEAFISVASLVPFEVQLRDDYGLVKLEVAYDVVVRANDKDTIVNRGTIPLDHAALTGRVDAVQQIVRVADLNLAPGQRVVFRVSATDNRPGHPNVGQAADVGLQVVTPDELKRVIESEMTQMATLMRKLRDSESKQSEAILQRLTAEGQKL